MTTQTAVVKEFTLLGQSHDNTEKSMLEKLPEALCFGNFDQLHR